MGDPDVVNVRPIAVTMCVVGYQVAAGTEPSAGEQWALTFKQIKAKTLITALCSLHTSVIQMAFSMHDWPAAQPTLAMHGWR